MAASEGQSLDITSGGFELYVPPTPFAMGGPEKKDPISRFVMLDDENGVFYDVDYGSEPLRNSTPWSELALYNVVDPAVVFPPAQWQKLHDLDWLPTGFLVAIQSRDGNVFRAVKIGAVHVKRLPRDLMNWGALESLTGPELTAEVRAGLLRRVFDRRPGSNAGPVSYVNPKKVLDGMPRPWHRDGNWLNWELSHRFVGGKEIDEGQRWELYAE
jgi:hypothetical protein